MESRFTRTERVYGPDAVKKLDGSRVAVFGLGGVGGYALEALARSGIGALDLVDHDVVTVHRTFFLPDTAGDWDFSHYDYIVDCVDTVTAKLLLAGMAKSAGVPIISAMGTGNKKNPSLLRVSDLYETSVCPLARIMRKECRRRGIDRLKVVWSPEEPVQPFTDPEDGLAPSIPGSTAFVPAVAGLLLAAEVVNDLIRES